MFKKLLKSISIGVMMTFMVTALPMPAYAAGTPHTSYGIVTSGGAGDNWTLYVVARPSETLTGTLSDSGGTYFYQAQVGNLTTAWNDDDDSLAFVSRETNAGANNHAGYYAVMNEDLDVTTNPQQYNDCTVRQIPTPTAAQGSGSIDLTWSAAATDTSATPHGNNIAGYNVYRSTSQSSGFTKLNSSTVTVTNYSDTTGTTGTTYYYDIEPVFRGGVALGVYSANSNGVAFPAGSALNITTTSLPDGTVSSAYNQTVSATGGTTPYTWSISGGTLPAGLSLNSSSGVISGTPTATGTSNFTVMVTDNAADTDTQALSITINATGTGPNITSLSLASAEAGQTVVVTGTNFKAYSAGDSIIRFGTTVTTPTAWSDTSITVAVPTGLGTGEIAVTVVNADGNDSENITILGNKIYLDDYEGGAVGSFADPAINSGYYVFANVDDITPTDANINSQLKQAEAAHEGAYGAKVRYSYNGTDGSAWGGGWGAKLANPLDLSSMEAIELFIQWDGSTNEVTVSLKDADGTAFAATISNAILSGLTSHGKVTIMKSAFSHDVDGSDSSADSSFDWSDVTNYNLVYTTMDTTVNYHYIDSITADLPGGEDPGGDVQITSVVPMAGPAGTKITVLGSGFGSNQSLSMLMFENTSSGASYQAEILSWSNTQVEAIVPRLAASGNYEIKVIKIAIVAGTTTAQESNPASFRVTAGGANEGGVATIWPNPFNPLADAITASDVKTANIAFNPGSATNFDIYIYDMTGRLVQHRSVNIGAADASARALAWDGTQAVWTGYDANNNLAGDGVYILRIVDHDSKRLIAKGKILVIKQ